MTNEQAIEAVLAWVAAVIPAMVGKTYKHEPDAKVAALPDCVGQLEHEAVVRDDPDFAIYQLQGVVLRRFDLTLFFMTEAGVSTAAAEASVVALRAFAQALTLSVLADETLGGRVPAASPVIEFDYTPAFAEYDDGTIGRPMTMSLAVGVPINMGDPLA